MPDDALTAIQRDFPGWQTWRSSNEPGRLARYWATRLGAARRRPARPPARWAMTVDGDSPAELRLAIGEQEAIRTDPDGLASGCPAQRHPHPPRVTPAYQRRPRPAAGMEGRHSPLRQAPGTAGPASASRRPAPGELIPIRARDHPSRGERQQKEAQA